jgi:hypothetical protein
MAYIGKQPVVGNFQKCDAISVVNGQAAYTLNVGGAAVSPENANHMLVSLNGVLQAPGDSFTVSGSTLTFASNLATGDVIDFVIILGDVLDLGTPSDNSISTAKLVANSVTAAKFNADVISGQTALASEPADTDEFLVSDAGVLKRIDYSLIKGSSTHTLLSTTTISADTANIVFNSSVITSSYKRFMLDFDSIIIDAQGKINMKISSDNGSNYKSGSNYRYSAFSTESAGNARNQADGAASGGFQLFADTTSATTRPNNFRMFIYDPLNTSTFFSYFVSGISHDVQDDAMPFVSGGFYTADADNAFNAIKFTPESGNFDSGVIRFYGIS